MRTRYRDPSDELKLVIVRDMWLTGFDAPCMHTLYVDKPMRGHGLMQAITRINRVFGSKPAGLVVDYIGLAADLKKALKHYSNADQKQTGVSQDEAVHALHTQLDIMRGMFFAVPYMDAVNGTAADRIKILPIAIEHALTLKVDGKEAVNREDSKKRFMKAVAGLVKAFRIAAGTHEAAAAKDEVGFFVAIQSAIRKMDASTRTARTAEDAELAISQLLNRAVASTEVIDILEAAGIDKPDISVLSEDFLLGLQNTPHKNLAVEALKKASEWRDPRPHPYQQDAERGLLQTPAGRHGAISQPQHRRGAGHQRDDRYGATAPGAARGRSDRRGSRLLRCLAAERECARPQWAMRNCGWLPRSW